MSRDFYTYPTQHHKPKYITDSQIVFLDIPLVEQFRLRRVTKERIEIAWLENKIYVTYFGIKRVRVFSDQVPFNELPEGIEIKELLFARGMAASATTRSLFISDSLGCCVWKIEFPNNILKCYHCFLLVPTLISITPDDELLVVVDDDRMGLCTPVHYTFSIKIVSQSDFSQIRYIQVPLTVYYIFCAAQLLNKSIAISYGTDYDAFEIWISILSIDGEVLRNFDPNVFESIRQNPWYPKYFAIKENGDIFVIDSERGRVFLFNSRLSDYQLISYNDRRLERPTRIVYIKEKEQLLVHEHIGLLSGTFPHLSVFHLGPCNLIQRRNDEERVSVTKITRKRKTLDFTSKYRKLQLQKKQKLLL